MSAKFGLNLLTQASRERCMMNLKKFRIPYELYSCRRNERKPTASAAVLVPLCEVNDGISLLYTARSSLLKSYSGQISYPGGKTDKDETPIQTALRETYEEIGLASDRIDIWGSSEQAVPSYNVLITPVIGCIKNLKENDLIINKNEVNKVFTVSLDILSDTKNQYHTQYKDGLILPVYVAGNIKIWGLTAYITHMFLSSLLPEEVYKND